MTNGNDAPDRFEAEKQLVSLVGERKAKRLGMGNDAIWMAA